LYLISYLRYNINQKKDVEVTMKIHKYLGLVIVSLALLSTGFAKDKVVVQSRWAAAPVQIDGNSSDWVPEDMVKNKDFDLSYAFKNDANFLYVLVVFDLKEVGKGRLENKYMSTIGLTGLTLWLNAEDKEKKTGGLRFYRKQASSDHLILELEKQGQMLTDQQKKDIKSKPSHMLFVCDVINNKGQAVPHPGTSGTFRTAKAEKSMVFEYVVPLALLQDAASPSKWDPALPLKVGFEWGGMTDEMKRNYAGRVADQGVAARAGESSLEAQVGGEEGSDFRASDSSLGASMRGLPKKYDFWIDLKFAAKQ
jgi:hypothetical protein